MFKQPMLKNSVHGVYRDTEIGEKVNIGPITLPFCDKQDVNKKEFFPEN